MILQLHHGEAPDLVRGKDGCGTSIKSNRKGNPRYDHEGGRDPFPHVHG
jgi:hypothetical protein